MERVDFQTTISPYKYVGDKICLSDDLQEIVVRTKSTVEVILNDCKNHRFTPNSNHKKRAFKLIEREVDHLNYYSLKDRQICLLTDLLKDKKALLSELKNEDSFLV